MNESIRKSKTWSIRLTVCVSVLSQHFRIDIEQTRFSSTKRSVVHFDSPVAQRLLLFAIWALVIHAPTIAIAHENLASSQKRHIQHRNNVSFQGVGKPRHHWIRFQKNLRSMRHRRACREEVIARAIVQANPTVIRIKETQIKRKDTLWNRGRKKERGVDTGRISRLARAGSKKTQVVPCSLGFILFSLSSHFALQICEHTITRSKGRYQSEVERARGNGEKVCFKIGE